jgi:hypothetical protein
VWFWPFWFHLRPVPADGRPMLRLFFQHLVMMLRSFGDSWRMEAQQFAYLSSVGQKL